MAQAETDFSTILENSLATLPADEAVLIPLYDAYRLAAEVLMGIFNQPRAQTEALEAILEGEIERMNDHACAVAVKLSHLRSVSSCCRDSYVQTMVSHAFFTG